MIIVRDIEHYKKELEYYKEQCFEDHVDKQKLLKAMEDAVTEETNTFEVKLVIEYVKKELGI